MEQKENFDDVNDESQSLNREITFRSAREPSVIPFLNQTRKDKERLYFSPVTAHGTYNIAGHYLVQTVYENLSVLRRENSKSHWFPGPCTFVRHLGEADHRMLWQAAERSCATLADIRVLGTDDDKAIYNAILRECNPMTFHILGLEHTKKNISDKLKDLNIPNCQAKKKINDILTDLYNCSDANTYQNKLTELKERCLEIEPRFTRNKLAAQFVKYFGKYKNQEMKFKSTKFIRERACLKGNYS